MTVTRQRFASGLTYDGYKAAMQRNRDRVEENERNVQLDAAAVKSISALPRPLHVLVLAEDWCGDVIANLPVLGRLAQATGKLDVRVFYRDQNEDLIARWLNQGKYKSIPVVVLFDDSFRELGHWIERPASVTKVRAERREAIYKADPVFGSPDGPVDQLPEDVRARLQAEIAKMRTETTSFANAEVQRELAELISAVAV